MSGAGWRGRTAHNRVCCPQWCRWMETLHILHIVSPSASVFACRRNISHQSLRGGSSSAMRWKGVGVGLWAATNNVLWHVRADTMHAFFECALHLLAACQGNLVSKNKLNHIATVGRTYQISKQVGSLDRDWTCSTHRILLAWIL